MLQPTLEGLLVGMGSGVNLEAALRKKLGLASQFGRQKRDTLGE